MGFLKKAYEEVRETYRQEKKIGGGSVKPNNDSYYAKGQRLAERGASKAKAFANEYGKKKVTYNPGRVPEPTPRKEKDTGPRYKRVGLTGGVLFR